ncbi:MAG: ABC transporter permease [Oscillospiraceae bacterium]|nr:ABC transporter permease [Oscillospiraceae bacterium]
MTIVAVLYLVMWTVLLHYFQNSFRPHDLQGQVKAVASVLLTQTGLQFSSMLMCLLTIMLGAGSIASELENGMIHAVLSRPLRRLEYVLGKFVGLVVLLFIYATLLFSAILLVGLIFSLDTVTALTFSQIIRGWLLYLLVPIVVLCITIFGSVTLKVVPNGLLMIFIYILGNIGGMVEMIGKYISNSTITSAGVFLSLISPFQTIFATCQRVLIPSSGILGDMMQGAGGLSGFGEPASFWMFIYIAIYAVAFIVLAIRKFDKLDIN